MTCAKTVRPLFTGHSFREGLAPVYSEIEIDFAHDDHSSLAGSAVTAMV
jgi:hypothetical protein